MLAHQGCLCMALVSRWKVVWAMAELSALERLMHSRKHDGLPWRDRMFDLALLSRHLVVATSETLRPKGVLMCTILQSFQSSLA